MSSLSTALALLLLVLPALGFSPATPWRHVVTSEDMFVFVMDPGNFADIPARGIAYKATQNGFEKLWETSGWYGKPGELFLSACGKTLVRIRREVIKTENTKIGDEPVLFFYRNGKLKAEYRISDLIENITEGTQRNPFGPWGTLWMEKAVISPSELHRVETKVEGKSAVVQHPDVFHLSTLEGSQMIFDLKSGNPLGEKRLEIRQPEFNETPDGDPFATK